jgi:hypothetical protein
VFESFGFKSSRQIRVVIYPSGESYTNASGAPAWSGAVFDGNLRIPISPGNLADDRALLRVTTHELTHFVIGEITWATCPAWLNEGLAQLEEGADMKWAFTLLRSHWPGSRETPVYKRLPSLETSFAGLDTDDANLAYAEAYFAARFLTEQFGRNMVLTILHDLGQRTPFPESLKSRTGLDYATFENRMLWWARPLLWPE